MQIDLEGDSNFFCGIAYSQAPESKPPRKEGGNGGGVCVLFWRGFIYIAWSSTCCRACWPLAPDAGELCSSLLRGTAMQPGSPSFIAFAPALRAEQGGKPARALRCHDTSIGCMRRGS